METTRWWIHCPAGAASCGAPPVWGESMWERAWTLVSWTLEATAFYARSDQEWVLCACGQW